MREERKLLNGCGCFYSLVKEKLFDKTERFLQYCAVRHRAKQVNFQTIFW